MYSDKHPASSIFLFINFLLKYNLSKKNAHQWIAQWIITNWTTLPIISTQIQKQNVASLESLPVAQPLPRGNQYLDLEQHRLVLLFWLHVHGRCNMSSFVSGFLRCVWCICAAVWFLRSLSLLWSILLGDYPTRSPVDAFFWWAFRVVVFFFTLGPIWPLLLRAILCMPTSTCFCWTQT